VSRSETLRQVLAEVLRPYQGQAQDTEGPRVKFLINNAIIEGTLDLRHNLRLLSASPYANGQNFEGEDFDAIWLTDVAVRPLNEPEVHVGLNKLQLFLEAITGVIS